VTNAAGYLELDPHIGLIYGDSITLERAERILAGLANAGFASNNVVFGVGSYTYQMITRDTLGWAIKATSVVVNGERRAISKDPVTDDGGKRSAQGLLRVDRNEQSGYVLVQNCSEEAERGGCLEPVFQDGRLLREQTLEDIRDMVRV